MKKIDNFPKYLGIPKYKLGKIGPIITMADINEKDPKKYKELLYNGLTSIFEKIYNDKKI